MKVKARFLNVSIAQESVIGTDSAKPRFVLSTERPATDNCIVRQYWDLSRLHGCGIPVFDSHQRDKSLGRWDTLQVVNTPERRLEGDFIWNPFEPLSSQRKSEWEARFLNAVSIGWIPGETTRRSELPKTDPYYSEATEDECGFASEGYVYGSERSPNVLLECSLTFIPADSSAVSLRNAAGLFPSGPVDEASLARSLHVLSKSDTAMAQIRSWIERTYGLQPISRNSKLDSVPHPDKTFLE